MQRNLLAQSHVPELDRPIETRRHEKVRRVIGKARNVDVALVNVFVRQELLLGLNVIDFDARRTAAWGVLEQKEVRREKRNREILCLTASTHSTDKELGIVAVDGNVCEPFKVLVLANCAGFFLCR